MQISAAEIAILTGGTVVGNSDVEIRRVDKLEEAGSASLSFFSNPKYQDRFFQTNAALVLIPADFTAEQDFPCTVIKTANPYYAFCQVLDRYFNPNQHKSGREESSFIADNADVAEEVYVGFGAYVDDAAVIGKGVKIYPNVYVGRNVHIGPNTILYPGVKVYADCRIGAHCIIHSGTVIGSDGFGFAPIGDGSYAKIPQIGNVLIEDHVEIGANCTIDRATLGSTILRKGVKFDNLIHIAHNVEVGENTYMAAACVVAGSTKIGKNCMFSGQVGIVGHIQVADNTIITAQSGISKTINKAGEIYMGSPAFEAGKYRKAFVHFRNLDQLSIKIQELDKWKKNQEK